MAQALKLDFKCDGYVIPLSVIIKLVLGIKKSVLNGDTQKIK